MIGTILGILMAIGLIGLIVEMIKSFRVSDYYSRKRWEEYKEDKRRDNKEKAKREAAQKKADQQWFSDEYDRITREIAERKRREANNGKDDEQL